MLLVQKFILANFKQLCVQNTILEKSSKSTKILRKINFTSKYIPILGNCGAENLNRILIYMDLYSKLIYKILVIYKKDWTRSFHCYTKPESEWRSRCCWAQNYLYILSNRSEGESDVTIRKGQLGVEHILQRFCTSSLGASRATQGFCRRKHDAIFI